MTIAAAMAVSIAALGLIGWEVARGQSAAPGDTVRIEPPPGGIVPQPGRGSIYREHRAEDRDSIARHDQHGGSVSAPQASRQPRTRHIMEHKGARPVE